MLCTPVSHTHSMEIQIPQAMLCTPVSCTRLLETLSRNQHTISTSHDVHTCIARAQWKHLCAINPQLAQAMLCTPAPRTHPMETSSRNQHTISTRRYLSVIQEYIWDIWKGVQKSQRSQRAPGVDLGRCATMCFLEKPHNCTKRFPTIGSATLMTLRPSG